ncbi:cytochrome c551/c552 [Pseudomonas psychrotolerans]|nr:cytochrome c551/c552 [Pseudomonas psychrotolerans]
MTLRKYAGLGALMSFVALPGLAMAQGSGCGTCHQ